MGVFPQKRSAERVYRLDIRLIHPQKLPLQMLIRRRFRQAFGKLGCDLAPQFRSSSFCISNDEEVIHIAVFFRDIPEQPLYQHFRFTGTGGGGYQ